MALALLTQMSIPPNLCHTGGDGRGDLLLEADIAGNRQRLAARLLHPRGRPSEMVPGSRGSGAAVLATTATLAPSRAALSAMARPMPRLAPVMNSVLPARDMP